MATTTTTPDTSEQEPPNRLFPELVDWAVAAVIALGGMLWVVGGGALALFVDRAMLAEGIESGTVSVTLLSADLTEAEMIEVADAIVSWTGVGLVLVGLGMVLFAAGYAVRRHRAQHQYPTDDHGSSFGAIVVLGALATTILSFLPFSPALGGALAGYLEHGESGRSIKAGALSGLLAILPFVGLVLFITGGVVTGLLEVTPTGLAIFSGMIVLLSLAIGTAVSAGLGALGGYAGGRFAGSRMSPD